MSVFLTISDDRVIYRDRINRTYIIKLLREFKEEKEQTESQAKKKAIIDLDGKNFYNTKDDYLFDVGRKNVAVSSGLLYYRLWSMNYFNAKKEELNRISSKLGAKQVK